MLNLLVFLTLQSSTPWQQGVRYWIHARLDDSLNTIFAHEDVQYVNNSPDTLNCIYFHLYPNAFKKGSVYFRERERLFGDYSHRDADESDFGWIDVTSPTVNGLKPLSVKVTDTEMKMELPAPLPPHDTLRVSLDFVVHIPKPWDRFGHEGHHYAITQWYPKVVVYDEKGWHPDGYHALGEFYGEFAHYDVDFIVPKKYVVASTGEIVAPQNYLARLDSIASNLEVDTSIDSAVKLHIVADSVHDFAIVAAPDYKILRIQCGRINVKAVFWRDHNLFATLPNFICTVIDSYQRWYGPYPYKNLTIAQAPHQNPMEYPQLVIMPPRRRTRIMIGPGRGNSFTSSVVHEVAHQWFYGVLANNEMDEAWLDEGFVTFTQNRIMAIIDSSTDEKDRPSLTNLGLRFIIGTPYDRPIVGTRPYESQVYWLNAYLKGSKILAMIRWSVGDTLFDSIMHTYYREFAFKHVSSADFQHVVEKVTGEKWDWFFKPWLYTTSYPDFQLDRVIVRDSQTLIAVNKSGPFMPTPIKCGDSIFKLPAQKTILKASSPCRSPVLDPNDLFIETRETNNGLGTRVGMLVPRLNYMQNEWLFIPVISLKTPGVSFLNLDYDDLRGTLVSTIYHPAPEVKHPETGESHASSFFWFATSRSLRPGVNNLYIQFNGFIFSTKGFDPNFDFYLGSERTELNDIFPTRVSKYDFGGKFRLYTDIYFLLPFSEDLFYDTTMSGDVDTLTLSGVYAGLYYSLTHSQKAYYASTSYGIGIDAGVSSSYRTGIQLRLRGFVDVQFNKFPWLEVRIESEQSLTDFCMAFDRPSVGGHRIFDFNWMVGPGLPGYFDRQLKLSGKNFTDVKVFSPRAGIFSLYWAMGWLDFYRPPFQEAGINVALPQMLGGSQAPQLFFPVWISDPPEGGKNLGFRMVFVIPMGV